MSVAILRQLSAGFASISAALKEAADAAQTETVGKPAEAPAAGKGKGKGKAAPAPTPEPDPLAGLTNGAEEQENEPEVPADDPLAALMGGDEPDEPAAPSITREGLAKLLGQLANEVDRVRGKGKGAAALEALFKKHGAADLKSLAEEEFGGVQNEATAIIDAIKKATA